MPKWDTAPVVPSAANAAHVAAFERSLAIAPAATRRAYVRDLGILAARAGDRDLAGLTRPELARALATLDGRGLSGRSLARMLSAWRAFFRFLLEVERGAEGDGENKG